LKVVGAQPCEARVILWIILRESAQSKEEHGQWEQSRVAGGDSLATSKTLVKVVFSKT